MCLLSSLVLACGAAPAPPHPEVVFVCEHGAAKSVVATAYFNTLASERGLEVRAVARGADPQDKPSTAATEGLRRDGLRPGVDPPRPLTAADVRNSSRVVTFDCNQRAMTALRGMDVCWDDVPATSDDYGRARDVIRAHVTSMIEELATARPAAR